MNFPDHLYPQAWEWSAHALLALLLGWAALRAPWRLLADERRQHVFLGAIVCLAMLWGLRAGVKPGLTLHFLGATALTLMFGPHLALIAFGAVLAATVAAGGIGLSAVSLAGLLLGALPVALSQAVLHQVVRHLPANFFVYVFAAAFFGAALVVFATGAAVTGAAAVAGLYPIGYLLEEYLPYYLLLAWGEAFMTGMLITLMVVYRPHWVSTFDDRRYLRGS